MSSKRKVISSIPSTVSALSTPRVGAVEGAANGVADGAGAARPAAVGRGPKSRERFWLETLAVQAARRLGSLQLAITLLVLFAVVLAVGTMMDSWYSDKVSSDLVYRTWWFNLLLFLLGVNILFAALKKWPWKKHQTGFLITHLGLITMVVGGLLNGLGGTDTQMGLVPTDDRRIQNQFGMPRAGHEVADRDTFAIRVTTVKGGREEVRAFAFRPGSLAWRADDYIRPALSPLVEALDWLDHPFPKAWRADWGADSSIEVLNYYPHVRREECRPAAAGDRDVFPAVKLHLGSSLPMMRSMDPERWVGGSVEKSVWSLMGIGEVRMLGPMPAGLVEEFRRPPAGVSEKGELVLRLGDKLRRVEVAGAVGGPGVDLGEGWTAKVLRFEAGRAGNGAGDPRVELGFAGPGGRTTFAAVEGTAPARELALPQAGRRLRLWYHAPDQRFGQDGLRSVLQFVVDAEGRLFYRSYSSTRGAFAFQGAGEAAKGADEVSIWDPAAGWKFRVVELLPRAVADDWFIPEDRRPGLQDAVVKPAIRCRVTVGRDSKEVWVGQTEADGTAVSVGGQALRVGLNERRTDLGFQVKLLRGETLVDPGTQQQAGYSSWVELSDPSRHVEAEDRYITMNQPLKYRGLKFFQSGLATEPVFEEGTLKPVFWSVFTVSSDPGLWLKYVGSAMVALGIACMFYMKAYFFKPRGRRTDAAGVAGGL